MTLKTLEAVLVLMLAGDDAALEGPDSSRGKIPAEFPTGALATLESEGQWSTLAPGDARLTADVRPKSLA